MKGYVASSEEAMIPVSGKGTTATTKQSSKTHVTTMTTFFKNIPQLMLLGELSSAYLLIKIIVLKFKNPNYTTGKEVIPLSGKNWQKIRIFCR